MMKRIHILLMALLMGMLSHAQLLPTDDTRYGAKDPQKAIELYKEVFAQNSPVVQGNESMPITEEFYIKFRRLAELAPYFNYYLYSGYFYENPTSMYQRMLDSIADPAFKVMLVEDAVACGQMFVDHLDSINVVRDWNPQTKGNPLTMPLAKIKRAHYNYKFAHDPKYYPAHLYDKEKAYKLYREAFKEFLAAKDSSNQQNNKELPGFYVSEYYKVCEDLYKVDEERYYEQFLNDYQEIVQVCDKLLIPCYDDPDSLKRYSQDDKYVLYRDYMGATYGVNEETGDTVGVKLLFTNSGAGTADRLRAFYAPRLEPNRENKEFLDNAISFMYANNFTVDTLVYEYCKASYDLGRTYENCIGLAYSSYIGCVDKDDMRKYFLEALERSTSGIEKARIRYEIAKSLYTTRPVDPMTNKNYAFGTPEYNRWREEIEVCNSNLKAMLQSTEEILKSPSLMIRDMVPHAYYMLAENNYMELAQYLDLNIGNESLKYLQEVTQYNISDPKITRGRMVNVQGLAERFEKLMTAVRNAKKEQAANKKKQAEYEEYMRKKKQEEEFWKQK